MHGPSLAHLIVAAFLGANPGPSADLVGQADRALAAGRPADAVSALESALAGRPPEADRAAILGKLPAAYESAARQADARNRPAEAETYRENARIITRKSAASVARPSAPAARAQAGPEAPSPAAPAPAPIATLAPEVAPRPATEPTPLPDLSLPVAATSTPVDEANANISEVATGEPTPSLTGRSPSTEVPATPAQPSKPVDLPPAEDPRLLEADAAFRAKKYTEAGKLYARLAADKALPEGRRDHWAYCRSYDVARKINARPRTESDWASIDAEIDQIRALNPNNWLGEYLRNRAADRPGARKGPASNAKVVRASAPEEPASAPAPKPAATARPARMPTVATGSPAPAEASAPASPAKPSADLNGASRIGTAYGRWQVRESANFRVYHVDPALADKVLEVAEATRRDQMKRWSNSPRAVAWLPQCDIYLYPSGRQYAQMTGQPEDSPGFSTMGMNEGRVISRRVNLRTDHPGLVAAVLPHEVTHVILADFFPQQQIPRWADEGMAVLSEPADEQTLRANDLVEPLNRNLLFPIETLMTMDYPDNRYWKLYYAQSVSLTRFLVDQGGHARLVDFLQGAQKNGFEAELKRVYKIEGYDDLQARWVAYARTKRDPETATASHTTTTTPPATATAPPAESRVR